MSRDTSAVAAPLRAFGDREDDQFGIDSQVKVTSPSAADGAPNPERADIPDGGHFLTAPLLTLQQVSKSSLLLVGRCHVLVDDNRLPQIHVIVEEAWESTPSQADDGGLRAAPRGWRTVSDHPDLERAVRAALVRPRHRDPEDSAWRAVTIAKAIAEHTRNSASRIRNLRYDAERNFGERLRGSGTSVHLADLVELSIAASRARDLCREASREGLWLWRTDKDVYHAHRRLLDPTLARRETMPELPPWFPTLDAGVRQCRAAVDEFADEADQLHRLLEAASTISVAKDAQAQEQFNFVATVGAVTLGLPALVLGVYGAAEPDFRHQLWIVPFVVCGIVSIAVAWHLTTERVDLRPKTLTAIAVLATVGIAEFAAWVAH